MTEKTISKKVKFVIVTQIIGMCIVSLMTVFESPLPLAMSMGVGAGLIVLSLAVWAYVMGDEAIKAMKHRDIEHLKNSN